MRRFKIKDVVIGPVPRAGLLSGPCQGEHAPRTDRPCAEAYTDEADEEHKGTSIPCREKSETGKPCGAHSDTSLGCADEATYRPCIQRGQVDTEPGCAKNVPTKCANLPGIPAPDRTQFRCVYDPQPNRDTKGVCRGGTDTRQPGWEGGPWHGCMPGGDATKKPCADVFNTRKPCWQKGQDQTRYACMEGREETQHPCRVGGKADEMTKVRCERLDTLEWPKDEKDECIYSEFCAHWYTTRNLTPYAEYRGALACPPLSELDLPQHDPATLEALALLRTELRRALDLVEDRYRTVKDAVTPKTTGEVADAERALQEALDDVRRRKAKRPRNPGRGRPAKNR